MAPPVCPSHAVYRSVQTDLTINKIKELESKSALDLEMRDNRIEELQRVSFEWLSYFLIIIIIGLNSVYTEFHQP